MNAFEVAASVLGDPLGLLGDPVGSLGGLGSFLAPKGEKGS